MFKYRIYFVRLYFKIYQFKYFESYQVNFISEKILKMINKDTLLAYDRFEETNDNRKILKNFNKRGYEKKT